MKRIFILTLLITVFLVGCKEEKKKSEGVNIEFPGGSVRVGEEGVDVKAPGVDVKVDKKQVGVNAGDVGVQVDKDTKVGVQAPGVDVDVKRGGSEGE